MSRRSRGSLAKENSGPSADDKSSLRTALIVALIGAAATVLATVLGVVATAWINNGSNNTVQSEAPGGMPPPDCPTCITGGKTFTQQAGMGNSKPTFLDPRAFMGRGDPVPPGQRIEVVCRFNDPNAPSSVQPGWWYLIASPPWNRRYYTVANSYLNGDPPQGPHLADVDNGVPVC
jgi:hypothetical protein